MLRMFSDMASLLYYEVALAGIDPLHPDVGMIVMKIVHLKDRLRKSGVYMPKDLQ